VAVIPGSRVIVCDDDAVVRGLISDLVEQREGEVIAETGNSYDAIALIERFAPDLIILDLSLEHGTGTDVIDFIARREVPTEVIIFTSFDGVVDTEHAFVRVVRKPGFDELELQLDDDHRRLAPGGERRRTTRAVTAPVSRSARGLDDPDDFYRILGDAHPTDSLLAVSTADDADELAATMRSTIRVQDRLLARGDHVVALLIGGRVEAPDAVRARLRSAVPDVDDRSTSAAVGDDPVGTFMSLG
jgi:CheY-like chemotaxis protein